MLRIIYTLCFALVMPIILARLWWRGRKEVGYRRHIGERFGRYSTTAHPALSGAIWIHAVSVGEVRAAAPLIQACEKQFPNQSILLTCMTPTGRAMATELFSTRATIAYLPYDFPFAIRRLIIHFKPSCLLIMETEIWFNVVATCRAENLPVLLVNARLSERSRAGYAKLAPIRALVGEALGKINVIGAQSADDAARFASLGAKNVVVTGNMKFDFVPDEALVATGVAWRKALPMTRKSVLLIANSRDGEERMLLDAYKKVFDQAARQNMLLVIVPRHPQRFNEVFQLIREKGLVAARRSVTTNLAATANATANATATLTSDTEVWLGDSMGEMVAYYALCDVAIIGGSFEALGGHNLIEAAAVGKPVIIGEHVFNFSDAVRLGKEAGAVFQVRGADQAMSKAKVFLENDAIKQKMGQSALMFALAHKGATQATLSLLVSSVEQFPATPS